MLGRILKECIGSIGGAMIKIINSAGEVVAKIAHDLPYREELLNVFAKNGCTKWEHDEHDIKWYEPCKCCKDWGCEEGCECFKHM